MNGLDSTVPIGNGEEIFVGRLLSYAWSFATAINHIFIFLHNLPMNFEYSNTVNKICMVYSHIVPLHLLWTNV